MRFPKNSALNHYLQKHGKFIPRPMKPSAPMPRHKYAKRSLLHGSETLEEGSNAASNADEQKHHDKSRRKRKRDTNSFVQYPTSSFTPWASSRRRSTQHPPIPPRAEPPQIPPRRERKRSALEDLSTPEFTERPDRIFTEKGIGGRRGRSAPYREAKRMGAWVEHPGKRIFR